MPGEKTTIISPYQLDKEEIELIIEKFPFIKNTEIVNIIDKKIIAGVVIKYKSKVIDISLKTRLNSLKDSFS